MVQARIHLPELASASHPRRLQSPDGRRAVTDLAEGVVAPAKGPVVGGHATGMVAASAYLAESERPHDRDRPGAAGIEVACLWSRVRSVPSARHGHLLTTGRSAALPADTEPGSGSPSCAVSSRRMVAHCGWKVRWVWGAGSALRCRSPSRSAAGRSSTARIRVTRTPTSAAVVVPTPRAFRRYLWLLQKSPLQLLELGRRGEIVDPADTKSTGKRGERMWMRSAGSGPGISGSRHVYDRKIRSCVPERICTASPADTAPRVAEAQLNLHGRRPER